MGWVVGKGLIVFPVNKPDNDKTMITCDRGVQISGQVLTLVSLPVHPGSQGIPAEVTVVAMEGDFPTAYNYSFLEWYATPLKPSSPLTIIVRYIGLCS